MEPNDATVSTQSDEERIRAIIAERVAAIAARDLDALVRHHAPDVLAFDVLDPLRNTGADTTRERAERWISSYVDAPGYEVRDLQVTADDGAAFCHYLYRVSGTLTKGGEVDMWVRATVCFAKSGGEWRIVHEHQSVPFDGATGKASLTLKP